MNLPSVTVIVAARHEAANLAELIPCLARQSYPANLFEIIIVDDRSADGTPALLHELQQQYPFEHLRVKNVPTRYSSKKFALATGLKAARHDLILVTDADCRPGPNWVKRIVEAFQPNSIAVAGFSPVISKNSFLAGLLLIDSLAVAAHSLAGIAWRHPFLASGRNFAYRKSAFEQIGGFAGFEHEISGDDDLLLQRLAPLGEVDFALHPDAHVTSLGGPETIWAWLWQKRRHMSAGKKYAPGAQFGYLIFHFCNVMIWLSPFWLGMKGLFMLAAKLAADFAVLRQAAVRLSCRPRWVYFLGWEFMHALIYGVWGVFAFVGKIRWKE